MSRLHILPINDLSEHEEAMWCTCQPRVKDDVVIHINKKCLGEWEVDGDGQYLTYVTTFKPELLPILKKLSQSSNKEAQ